MSLGKNTYEFLNKYKGNAFESLLTSLSNCPLVYHRHLFFEYALKALKGNDKFETHYLKDPSKFFTVCSAQTVNRCGTNLKRSYIN